MTEVVSASTGGFVGRDRELRGLRAALETALTGRGALWLLTGDAGIGKSRLAAEVATHGAERGARVLWGRCWDGDGAPSYWPWVQVLRTYVMTAPKDVLELQLGSGASHLSGIVPEIEERFPETSPRAPYQEPEHARFALFDAVTSFIRSASASQPVLVVLDDLHWADVPSLMLLGFVARQLEDAAVFIVGMYRDIEAAIDPASARLIGEITALGTHLPLRGLERSAVSALVESAFDLRLSEEASQTIHGITGGNPLYIDETMRLLLAEGRIESLGDVRMGVPSGIGETIRRRLALLSPTTRDALALAAAAGMNFSLPVLERASDLSRGDLVGGLEEALTMRILTGGALDAYGFSHALVRQAIYEDIPPARRGELHRRVGEALEQVAGPWVDEHVAEIAHHFFEAALAADEPRAVDYATRAGNRALESLAYEEAAHHFKRALRALELLGGEAERRCRLLVCLGDAMWRAGDGGARDVFQRAADAARAIGSARLLADAALGYGEGLGGEGFTFRADEELIRLLEDALDAVGSTDERLRIRLLSRLAVELYWTPAAERRMACADEAVTIATRLDDPGLLLVALYSQQWALHAPDTLEDRLDAAERMVRLARRLRDPEMIYRGQHVRARTLLELGDSEGGRAQLEECSALAEQIRMPYYRWQAATWRAGRAIEGGQLDDAERLAVDALHIGGEGQQESAQFVYAAQMALINWCRGRYTQLEPAIAAFAGAYPWATAWRAALLMIYAEQGMTDRTRIAWEEAAGADFSDIHRDAFWLGTMWLLAVPCAVAEDRRRASELYEALLPYAKRNFGVVATSYGPVELPLGIYAAAAGRTDDSLRHFTGAVEECRRIGNVMLEAQALREYAAALLSAEQPARAREILAKAFSIMRAGGFEGLMVRARILEEALNSAERGRFVLRRDNDGWRFVWDGREMRLGHAKGLVYLHELLRRPGRDVHVLDLLTAMGTGNGERGSDELTGRPGDAGPIFDEEAKRAYRRRLAEVKGEVDEADAWNDAERAARARAELSALTAELARGLGLGGRHRVAGSSTERARVNVTRAIRSAVRRIAEELPEAGTHLNESVRTGTFCAYEPRDPLGWSL